jgi:hypothetical protein
MNMKKILFATLLITMGTFVAFSQSLSLSYEGNILEPSATIIMDGIANNNEMIIDIIVTNNAAVELLVKAKKVENSIVPESENTFCWAGQCYPPWIFVSPGVDTIPSGGSTSLGDFSGHYNPKSNIGESSISYVYWDDNNPNDSVMVTVIYSALVTGLKDNDETDFYISNPYPNPANHFVNFDYDFNHSNGQLLIYSLIGSLVKEINITNQKGTLQLSTDQMQEGFYFYTLSSTGKELKTGRFIISR